MSLTGQKIVYTIGFSIYIADHGETLRDTSVFFHVSAEGKLSTMISEEEVLSVCFAPLECKTSKPLPIFSVSLEMHFKIKDNSLVVIKHCGG